MNKLIQKKHIPKTAFTLVGLLFGMLFLPMAQAATIAQPVADTLAADFLGRDNMGNVHDGCQILGTGLSSGLVTEESQGALAWKMQAVDSFTAFISVRLIQSDTLIDTCDDVPTGTDQQPLIFDIPSASYVANEDYAFNTPITVINTVSGTFRLDPDKYYALGQVGGNGNWKPAANPNTRILIYGSANDDYANGFYAWNSNATPNDANIIDAYFVLSLPNADGGFGLIDDPEEGEVIISQSEAKSFSGSCAGVSDVDLYFYDSGVFAGSEQGIPCVSSAWSITAAFNFWNSEFWRVDLGGGAYLLDSVSYEVAIEGNIVTKPDLEDPDDENSPFFVDCDDYAGINFFNDGVFEGIFCYTKKTVFAIGGFFFEPPEAVSDKLMASVEEIKDSFPFSIFFDITETIESKLGEELTGTSLTFYVPPPFDHTFTILSPTLMEDVVGEDFKDVVFEAIMLLVWLMVMFAILHTIF